MTIELHPVTDENFNEWRTAVRHGFGEHVHPDDVVRLRNERAELDRLVAAVDTKSNRIIGTGGADSYWLTVPGGEMVPMAGVAYMTTSVTHRRQGAFSNMMNHIHDAARLYKKRGWLQIYSTYLNRTIYLVRNEGVKVPTSDLPVYTESEVNALRGLSREEVLTLHEAKVIFKGTISNP